MPLSNFERDQVIELLLAAATLDAERFGGDVLTLAQITLAEAEAAKRVRDLTPYQRGRHHAETGAPCASSDEQGDDADAYLEGYHDAQEEERERLEDGRLDQIERDFLDGECTLSGDYFARVCEDA